MIVPSLLVVPLYFYSLIDRKNASLYYPYVLVSSVLGIIYTIPLIIFKQMRIFHVKNFSGSIISHLTNTPYLFPFLWFVIFIKLYFIFYYPYNDSVDAFNYSIALGALYCIVYLLFQYFKK